LTDSFFTVTVCAALGAAAFAAVALEAGLAAGAFFASVAFFTGAAFAAAGLAATLFFAGCAAGVAFAGFSSTFFLENSAMMIPPKSKNMLSSLFYHRE
jgi:hypothetical protein